MSEKELIEGCIRNDKHCQRALFEQFAGKMLVVCMRYSSSKMAAEDILQEGFIKLFKSISTFRFQGSFEGWVRRIFVNTALSQYRFASSQNEVSMPENAEEDFEEAAIVDKLSVEEILKLIDSLPSGYKVVFNLYAIEGYSHKEIAEMLHINEGTSRSQFAKARLALKKKIIETEVILS